MVMPMETDNYHLLGILITSLLAVVILIGLKGRKKGRRSSGEMAGVAPESAGPAAEEEGGEGTDVIVVGAGVAGSALAYTLAQDGRKVHVIERDLTEPDRIVGELLQPGGYLKLMELGLQDCVEEIDAQRVLGYALFKNGKNTKLPYPLEKFHSDVAGRSFHNGRFIQRMREKVASLPNVKVEQGTVTSLLEQNGTVKGVIYKTKSNGEESVKTALAPLTIVCDGCFSNLRRALCSPKVDVPSCFVGLVLDSCSLPFPNHGHVILADPSPILFYPISSTEVRCLVDVPGTKVPSIVNGEMAEYLKSVVAPQLPPQIYDSFIASIDKGNIRTHPNRSMPAAPHPTPGALLMGDAFNMRHPLTGGGMTVALSDIVVLRDLLKPLRNLHDAQALCSYLESFYTLRKIHQRFKQIPQDHNIHKATVKRARVVYGRHSLTGGGMTVALSDAVMLRDLLKPLRNLHDVEALCSYLESFYTLRKPIASTINTLAGALYKVFSSSPDDAARNEMRSACFDYLSLGGVCSAGPIALLSGLNPRPLSLVCHFFAVAIYGVGRLVVPVPTVKGVWVGTRLISTACGIIFPIIKAEGVRQMFFPAMVPAYYRAPPTK